MNNNLPCAIDHTSCTDVCWQKMQAARDKGMNYPLVLCRKIRPKGAGFMHDEDALQQILTEIREIKSDVNTLKSDVSDLKQGQNKMQSDIKIIKQDVKKLYRLSDGAFADILNLGDRTDKLEEAK